ncbi:hypothetical protein EAF00_003860 [Botryotinia globosa]|nr:hypothetical protein EAF00_003860 [Botryotinia globosa]
MTKTNICKIDGNKNINNRGISAILIVLIIVLSTQAIRITNSDLENGKKSLQYLPITIQCYSINVDCDIYLQAPIDNHYCYPSAFSISFGISSKNSKSADIPTPYNTVVHSKIQKAKPSSTYSIIIYSKMQPAIRKKRTSVLWILSENKTILKMKKNDCL